MKTVKNILIVAIMFALSIGYSVNEETNPTKSKTVLVFSNVKKGHELIVKTVNGKVVYRETIERNGTYAKRFDLTALEDGQYIIELDKDFEIVLKPFNIVDHKVNFLKEQEASIFKPVVRLEDDKLMISQLALDKNPLNMELYYEGELIYQVKMETESIIEKVFKLSENQKGEYSLRFSSGDRIFNERFTL
ncbi:MAG: hypothetical protein AAF688_02895 [Bacteroidota bacterium]